MRIFLVTNNSTTEFRDPSRFVVAACAVGKDTFPRLSTPPRVTMTSLALQRAQGTPVRSHGSEVQNFAIRLAHDRGDWTSPI